ncbi:MAG: AMP-binding protein [Nitrospinae bacterium]|nr:AMP-binding protein [Nitrospinota bacterium]
MDDIFKLIKKQAEKNPTALAIIDEQGKEYDYKKLVELVEKYAASLRSHGLKTKDKVCIISHNRKTAACLSLSVTTITCCLPLDSNSTYSEFYEIFTRCGIDTVLSDDKSNTAITVAKELGLTGLYFDSLSREINHLFGENKSRRNPSNKIQDNDAILFHTSGTTSKPKIVPLTHANIIASMNNIAQSLELTPQDCCLHMLPTYHVGGLIDLFLVPLSTGGSVVFAEEISGRSFYRTLKRNRVTWFQGVPAIISEIVSLSKEKENGLIAKNSSLRFIRSVSSPLQENLSHTAQELFKAPVIEMYGMTETAGLITSNPLSNPNNKTGCVGKAFGPKVTIIDASGNSAPIGQKGEVAVSGPTVTRGYLEDESNNNLFIGEWLKTGDEGWLDQEAFLCLSGRIKEIINRGGEKISPREIEDIITENPNINDAAAFAFPHESLGEEVAVAVVKKRTSNIEEKEIIDYCKERMSYYKIPRLVFFCEELPRTVGGKLLRWKLKEMYSESIQEKTEATYKKPEGETAELLAGMWEKALSVRKVGMDDNFFDLGGDSLKAFTFIHELEEKKGMEVHVASLFNFPTLSAFSQYVETLGINKPPEKSVQDIILPEEIRQVMTKYLLGWKGERHSNDSLIVGKNTLGSEQPIFWIINCYEEFEEFSRCLGNNQPVYGMRSLIKIKKRTEDTIDLLARYYIKEMREIKPEGPYLLGGFCEGAKIAFSMAKLLKNKNIEVPLLCLQDVFIPKPYDGRIAYFVAPGCKYNPYYFYTQPEMGWSKLYSGKLSLYQYDFEHDYFYQKGYIENVVKDVQEEIKLAGEKRVSPKQINPLSLQKLNKEDYAAEITADIPRFLSPGKTIKIVVKVKNLSKITWLPSKKSGIKLANRWKKDAHIYRSGIDGCSEIVEEVLPGKSIEISHKITAPKKKYKMRIVDIDLIDEGITWFQEKGSKPLQKRMYII